MKILILNKLSIKNFRCFEDFEINFDDKLNVIVGNNGSGKTTLLDAISIAVGTLFVGIDGTVSNSIRKNDAHYKRYEMGSVIDIQSQYPVEISSVGSFDSEVLKWKRTLNGEKSKTTTIDAKELINYSKELEKKVKNGDKSVILPIVAYYGTGRLWSQKKEKKGSLELKQFSRISGYVDSLESSSNEKMMLKWFEKMTLLQLQKGSLIPELEVVKNAVVKCFKGIKNISDANLFFNIESHCIDIDYKDIDGKLYRYHVNDLSDGYKNTLSLIADIAYRMAILNPQCMDRVLEETGGIVLIDEIDLHLHPQWQQRIIGDLQSIFPKVQFIVTTHAPIVIQSVPKENIIVLENNEAYSINQQVYGRDVNSILREVMGVSERPKDIKEMFNNFYSFLDKEDFENASEILNRIENIVGETDTDYVNARMTLDLELL